jgi:hypothetical protein
VTMIHSENTSKKKCCKFRNKITLLLLLYGRLSPYPHL